jgi:hypothetical protein
MKQDNNVVRRVGLGQGWESAKDNTPVIKAVRVRSGTHLTTGRMIGDTRQPRAFVWVEEAANEPKRELVICPDMQGSWLWEDGRDTTLSLAFPGNKEVQQLARRFDYWLKFQEAHWSPKKSQHFFWGRFHEEGVALARKLQALVVEEAVVRYWRQVQDPRSSTEREIPL